MPTMATWWHVHHTVAVERGQGGAPMVEDVMPQRCVTFLPNARPKPEALGHASTSLSG